MRFDHASVQKIAKAHGKDQAQIMLRWGLQHVSVYSIQLSLSSESRAVCKLIPIGHDHHPQVGLAEAYHLQLADLRL
jgi:hypothetical protein